MGELMVVKLGDAYVGPTGIYEAHKESRHGMEVFVIYLTALREQPTPMKQEIRTYLSEGKCLENLVKLLQKREEKQ